MDVLTPCFSLHFGRGSLEKKFRINRLLSFLEFKMLMVLRDAMVKNESSLSATGSFRSHAIWFPVGWLPGQYKIRVVLTFDELLRINTASVMIKAFEVQSFVPSSQFIFGVVGMDYWWFTPRMKPKCSDRMLSNGKLGVDTLCFGFKSNRSKRLIKSL